jgi:hypothetical protein
LWDTTVAVSLTELEIKEVPDVFHAENICFSFLRNILYIFYNTKYKLIAAFWDLQMYANQTRIMLRQKTFSRNGIKSKGGIRTPPVFPVISKVILLFEQHVFSRFR